MVRGCRLSKRQSTQNTKINVFLPSFLRAVGAYAWRGSAVSLMIIGFGKVTVKDLGETGPEQSCVWCSARVYYHLILTRTWFTYFFVPVIPYRREYRVECPACSCGIGLRGAEVGAAKRGELRISSRATL